MNELKVEGVRGVLRSRTFGLILVWILFICAGVGTYVLSKHIETKGNNAASVFTASGTIHEVSLYENKIEPNDMTIKQGDEVVFLTKDTSRHNLAEDRTRRNDARLESGEFGAEESYSLVFKTKGTISFYDRMNQDIRITIQIK